MVRSDLMWAIDQSLRRQSGAAAGIVRRRPPGAIRRLASAAARRSTRPTSPSIWKRSTAGRSFSLAALREGLDGADRIDAGLPPERRGPLEILNRVRDGAIDADKLALLNARVRPIRTLAEGEPYVILTPTNAAASRINMAYPRRLSPGGPVPMPRASRVSSAPRRIRPRRSLVPARGQGHAVAQRSGATLG